MYCIWLHMCWNACIRTQPRARHTHIFMRYINFWKQKNLFGSYTIYSFFVSFLHSQLHLLIERQQIFIFIMYEMHFHWCTKTWNTIKRRSILKLTSIGRVYRVFLCDYMSECVSLSAIYYCLQISKFHVQTYHYLTNILGKQLCTHSKVHKYRAQCLVLADSINAY